MSEPSTSFPSAAGTEIGAPPVIAAPLPWAKSRWLWVALGLAAALLLGLLAAFNPANHSFYPICIFYRVTGWQCPGCGGLRAVHQLLHGHIATAFRYNQGVVMVLPVVLTLAARRWLYGPGKPQSHRAKARWAWAAFALLVVFWIVRNLPVEFFRPPA
jgi:hypothetical protein